MNKRVVVWPIASEWPLTHKGSSGESVAEGLTEIMSRRVGDVHDASGRLSLSVIERPRSLDVSDVDYGLVFGGVVMPEELASLGDLLDRAESESRIPKRKELLRAARIQIDHILSRPVSMNRWAECLLYDARIDMSQRTIIFATTVDEAERIRDSLNEELVFARQVQRARTVHHLDWRHHDKALSDFRLDTHYPILVVVRRLESMDDLPPVENVVFLGDRTRELFLSQIAWVSSIGKARVIECAPSLDHAVSVMNAQVERKVEGEACGGFAMCTDREQTHSAAFVWLMEQYMSQMRTIRHVFSTADGWRSALLPHGVTDGSSLKKFWAVQFSRHFGASELARFLGREIEHADVRIGDLRDLAIKLGWEMKIIESLGTDTDMIRTNLARQGISNGDDLKQKGLSWFKSTFWSSDLGKVLGRSIRNSTISWTDLQELCTLIGWGLVIDDIPVRRSKR